MPSSSFHEVDTDLALGLVGYFKPGGKDREVAVLDGGILRPHSIYVCDVLSVWRLEKEVGCKMD